MGGKLIGSVGLDSSGVPDDLLTTKGDTHGFSSTNARIPIGDNDDVLTADSSEALGLKWAPASGAGSLVFVGQTVLGEAGGTIEVAFTSIAQADVSKMVLVLEAPADSQNSQLQINDITTSTYDTDGARVIGGTETIQSITNEAFWTIFNNNAGTPRVSYVEITSSRASNLVVGNISYCGSSGAGWSGISNTTTISAFTDFTALCNGGDSDFDSGSVLTVYRVNDS
tara:strand:- start:4 stop:681 length:678 start_codon:yes stop_codon:yes gene_type:complete